MSGIIGAGAEPGDPAMDADLIKDATIETFEEDVIKASMDAPVAVDFWADWCGPCKQLAPTLEQEVRAAGGKVRLVKVDIDKNQMLASQLRIQSIPTVYAFYQGRPVDGFQGAVPASEIKAFVERLVQLASGQGGKEPSVEDYLTAADAAVAKGDTAAAAQLYAQVAQNDQENVRALAGLAKCHLAMGDQEKARQTMALAPEDKQADPAFDPVRAALALAEESPGDDIGVLKERVQAQPDDLQARFDLASAHIAAGVMEAAVDELIALIERERDWNDEAARKKLLTVFDALGPAHPATLRGRRRLSSILFS